MKKFAGRDEKREQEKRGQTKKGTQQDESVKRQVCKNKDEAKTTRIISIYCDRGRESKPGLEIRIQHANKKTARNDGDEKGIGRGLKKRVRRIRHKRDSRNSSRDGDTEVDHSHIWEPRKSGPDYATGTASDSGGGGKTAVSEPVFLAHIPSAVHTTKQHIEHIRHRMRTKLPNQAQPLRPVTAPTKHKRLHLL